MQLTGNTRIVIIHRSTGTTAHILNPKGEYEAQQEEAILFHYEGGHDDDECSADLIAAAPELLAFVQKVVGHYEGTESGDEADRLVSKATGNA